MVNEETKIKDEISKLQEAMQHADETLLELEKKKPYNPENCVFCNLSGSAHKFKDKWVCDKCFDEHYKLYKTRYYVKRLDEITDEIEAVIKSRMKGVS